MSLGEGVDLLEGGEGEALAAGPLVHEQPLGDDALEVRGESPGGADAVEDMREGSQERSRGGMAGRGQLGEPAAGEVGDRRGLRGKIGEARGSCEVGQGIAPERDCGKRMIHKKEDYINEWPEEETLQA